VGRSSGSFAFRIVIAGALGVVGMSSAYAEQGGGTQQGHGQQNWRRGPVYQRKGSDWNKNFVHRDFRRKDRPFFQQQIPNVQSGWFTRLIRITLTFTK
jgi:hypothetical protein